jgi:putative membrane protein
MRVAKVLLAAHLGALLFGLGGLLLVIPNLALYASNPAAMRVYGFGMTYAGSLHIILGAAAMFAYGVAALGWRRTTVFFGFAVPISLVSELLGTTTGFPFGNYAYTDFLGYKVAGHVPFSIPLSWFYVGFACYLLGIGLTRRFNLAPVWAWGLALGAWFLTVWDLVLDPAMAHESLAVKFWEWSSTGPYFGMPIINFVGWTVTAFVFMAMARIAWAADPDPEREPIPMWFPFAVYVANTVFASALSASVGLWIPILLAVVLGILPAALALRLPRRAGATGETRLRPAASR